MPIPPAFQRDPRLVTIQARVIERREHDGTHVVVLSDTVLYPEGGGQPADRGTVDGVRVTDVRRSGGAIEHVVAEPILADEVTVGLDWVRRFDHMQQHTGQHLLTAIAADRFGWPTTAFPLGEHVCDVELDVPRLADADLDLLEEAARLVSQEEYAKLDVRSRGLPAGHVGDVRLVEIEGIDLNTCGGTHLASTSELETLKLLGTESMRGGTRLFFVAGRRVRTRLGAAHARAAELRAILGASDEELVAVVEARVAQAKEGAKAVRRLEEELAETVADAIAARPERLTVEHWPERGLAFLQKVARSVTAQVPGRVLLLTGGHEDQGVFVLAAGSAAPLDVAEVGPTVADVLEGSGGGSGSIFQGRATALAKRSEAEAQVRAALA